MRLPLRCSAAAFCLVLATSAWSRQDGGGELTFDLEEVSAFQAPGGLHSFFAAGQSVACTRSPDPNVHKYPAFVSGEVLYGAVELPRVPLGTQRGRRHAFALDRSTDRPHGYDRLYFDLNCDGDLTNDPPLAKQSTPPEGALLKDKSIKRQTCFECVRVPLPFGEDGTRAIELLPRLAIDEDRNARLAFVNTTARKGRVEIDGHTYEAWLGHNWHIGGSFDRPSTVLHLIANGDFNVPRGWMEYQLFTMRRIGGTCYKFSATPSGDRLMARPYTGDFGTLQVGIAGRKVHKTLVCGLLVCEPEIVLVDGGPVSYSALSPVSSCRLPIGDYRPWLDIWLDDLELGIWANLHADGRPRARVRESTAHAIQIRKDKPFVIDFSNKPEVLFVSPAAHQRVPVGADLCVRAILTDPVLDVMFINISRARSGLISPEVLLHEDYRSVHLALGVGLLVSACLWGIAFIIRSQRRLTIPAAGLVTVLTAVGAMVFYLSLRERSLTEGQYDEMTPQVTIARADGEVVAQGPMPFN